MARRESLEQRLAPLKERSTLQLTTFGRKTGRRHTVTVWFLVDGDAVYLATMNLRRDWVRNILKNGRTELSIDGSVFTGHAKPIKRTPDVARVQALLQQKYWAAWLASWLGLAPEGAFTVTLES